VNNPWATLTISLVVAVVGALAVVAYRHPDAYRKLANVLLMFEGAFALWFWGIGMGLDTAADQLKPYLNAKGLALIAPPQNRDLTRRETVWIILFCVGVYLVFLSWLPDMGITANERATNSKDT
jgi:hypothetical protein